MMGITVLHVRSAEGEPEEKEVAAQQCYNVARELQEMGELPKSGEIECLPTWREGVLVSAVFEVQTGEEEWYQIGVDVKSTLQTWGGTLQ